MFGFSLDRLAIAPYTTPLQRAIRPMGDIQSIVVQAPNADLLREGMESVRELLRGARHVGPSTRDNFELETQDSALEFFGQLQDRIMVFGAAPPAIGLVGGATRATVLWQFLVEAATMTQIGAALTGIAFGMMPAGRAATPDPVEALRCE